MGVMNLRRNILLNEPHIATAEGNPATFSTDMKGLLKQVKAAFSPVQSGSGDPSPSNVRPITGWTGVNVWHTGKNLLDPQARTTSANNIYFYWTNGITLSAGTYTLSCEEDVTSISAKDFSTGSNISVSYYKNFLTFTLSASQKIKIEIYKAGGLDKTQDCQLEVGSSATTYAHYSGTTIPVTFPAQGKNLLKPYPFTVTRTDVTFTYNADGSIHIEGNSNRWRYMSLPDDAKITLPAGTYKISSNPVSNIQAYVVQIGGTTLNDNSGKFVLTGETELKLQVLVKGNGEIDTTIYPQIEKGSSATAYEPYTNTAYGGTLDLTTGVLTVERMMYVNSGLDYTQWSMTTASVDANRFVFPWQYLPKKPKANSTANLLVTYMKATTNGSNGWTAFIGSTSNFLCYVPSSVAKDREEWAAYLAEHPLTFVYELDEPITYQLTPQQISSLLDNTIWSNANEDCTVQYWKH